MPSFHVTTPQRSYDAIVERGSLQRAVEFVPRGAGTIFIVTTQDVWQLHGSAIASGLSGRRYEVLLFPGGEARKRLVEVEKLAERMMELGGDRSSIVIAFGGGIVNDVGGFLAAIFMRGVPVIQVPTTLLAQVDAAVGGKTGVNLVSGKNLIGSFHQPLAVVIDPDVLATLAASRVSRGTVRNRQVRRDSRRGIVCAAGRFGGEGTGAGAGDGGARDRGRGAHQSRSGFGG